MINRILNGKLVLALTLLLASSSPVFSDDDISLVKTTNHFAFHSHFSTNLNDALIVTGVARNNNKREVFATRSDAGSCFEGLPPSARAGWNLAVDFYAEIISSQSWMSRQQYVLRMELAGFDDELDTKSKRYRDIAIGFRMAAAPAYEACHWPTQDQENRDWVGRLAPKLATYETEITGRLIEFYQTPWRGIPIRVDLVSGALPVGANTFHTPPHIVISSSTDDSDVLEIVHHEASHTLMRREDPIYRALGEAAQRRDMKLPRDLWHVVLFYTTGEAVRRTLADSGDPDYTPYIYAHDLWDGLWGSYRDAIEKTWPAYLDGRISLSEASSELLEALIKTGSPE